VPGVIIVGAGIAGLTAGIYARKSGFDVTIYEAHTCAGGNCTSWRRKGYLFEGGLHWLTGSGAKQQLHRVWREVGALTDESRITNHDPFIGCDWPSRAEGGQRVSLYRDLVKLETHLCEVSPEDTPRIKALCRDILRFTSFGMPVTDIPRLKVLGKSPSIIHSGLKMLPALLRILPLGALSVTDYAARFRHPAIRLLLTSVVNPAYDALSLLVTLGCFASGDGGYIEGGSLTLAANMTRRFEELGGVIRYGTKVAKVRIGSDRGSHDKACGVVAGGETIPADAVIVTSDTRTAIDAFFDAPLREKWVRTMRANTNRNGALLMCSFISIGVEADLSGLPESMTFPLETPIEHAGGRITALAYKLYSGSAGYAPRGCSAITLILAGDTYDYWKQARGQGRYDERKKELFEQIRGALEKQLPAIKDKVAVWDLATPLTYERYCGAWHGSWMTITPPGAMRVFYPCKSAHIRNLYFAGQRIMPPGGTPPAVSTGRTAAQYLCRDFGMVFKS
jgi:phytoene dehydrogenase-like protein